MVSLSNGIQSAFLPGGNTGAAFRAAGLAMAELGIAGGIGAAFVKKGSLTQETVSALSKTTFSILLPMFLSTSMIKTGGSLTRSSLSVPFLAVLNSFLLYLVSTHLLIPLFQLEDPNSDGGRSTTVCCSWGNSGVVPLIFCEALFRSQPALLAASYAQVSLYLVGWSPFFWSFGRSVLIADDQSTAVNSKATETNKSIRNRIYGLKRLFPPPVMGVFLGLITALTPLRGLFVSDGNDKAPLAVIFNSFQNLGRAANPLALLVLTSSLALGVSGSSGASYPESSDERSVVLRRWLCVSVARYILSPLFMYSLLKTAAKLGRIGSSTTDPMLWFILILQSCMPSAQNSVLMLQVADKGKEASSLAKFLFSVYFTAMLPVVLIVTIALQKLGLT